MSATPATLDHRPLAAHAPARCVLALLAAASLTLAACGSSSSPSTQPTSAAPAATTPTPVPAPTQTPTHPAAASTSTAGLGNRVTSVAACARRAGHDPGALVVCLSANGFHPTPALRPCLAAAHDAQAVDQCLQAGVR